MAKRGGTGTKSIWRRLGKASAGSRRTRTITDSDYEEPTPKRQEAEPDCSTAGNGRNRDAHGRVVPVPHRVEETRLTQSSGCTPGAYIGQHSLQSTTQITLHGAYGGNGGNGLGRGVGGFCSDYWVSPDVLRNSWPELTLHDILNGYLRCRPQAGGRYVERGDYSIVSEDDSPIVPVKFAQDVKAGMLLEMSIRLHMWLLASFLNTIQNITCPGCGCLNAITKENGWLKCATCARNYHQDLEEIVSPQLAQPNEA
ncbi:hypothetical protein B0H11DRAFT_2194236 [Mycena galericulata]|nr:hypothetical protein B0H11DRAFT_2194236 [Mycena galericulata]